MQGLTTHQATQLLIKNGQNILSECKKKTFIGKFIEQFNNFLTLLLLGAAGLSFIIGEQIDGVLIMAIVVLNALFGIFQEAKAEESIAALKKMSVAKVRVLRDGKEQEITSNLVVVGDICMVEEGVKIAADGILLHCMNIELNESALTGESLPVAKQKGDEVFSGTIVSKGRGIIHVTQTGMNTKFGHIAHQLSTIEDTETPLQIKLKQLTKTIGLVGIASAALVFIISLLRGEAYFPTFLLAISLAVAVVPEGLPAVMTITLAIGMNEMSKKKSIVRKMSAIEALGSITLIATDKTGTLTTNKMKVKEIFVDDHVYIEELPHMENHPFMHLVQNGILCSTASLVYKHDHGTYDVLGDPTEGALLFMAEELGLNFQEERKKNPIIEESSFDSVTKRMSVLVQGPRSRVEGLGSTLYTKGAPESILEISTLIQKGTQTYPLTPEERKKIEDQMDAWARKGLRVLAFSYKNVPENFKFKISNFKLEGQIFLGMVAIHDAPRPEVREAVERAQSAGIRVVMITGDNERTAEAIGVSAGLMKEGDDIITGKQLEEYSDEELMALLPKTTIFARTTPFQKHRIVSLFQRLGEVVAVTGDGVNDAIALKQADVGIAMGLVGTDVARETADMVITDDNFASIVVAVEEGRNIIKNLKNAIQYLLSCNISEAITLIGGMLLGFNHILFPIQLLYINLVTDGFPALSLAFSPRSSGIMKQRPTKELSLMNIKEKKYVLAVGILSSFLVLGGSYFGGRVFGGVGGTAAFTILTLTQSFIYSDLWVSHQSFRRHARTFLSPIFLAAFIFPFIAQYIIVHFSLPASVFKITPVSSMTYFVFICISSLVLIGIKILKRLI
ncbi:MAG: cation-translocating P-type ATPase [bacterium]